VIEKAFAVLQSKKGFESLYEKIRQTMKEAKKTDVIVGIEPTGHLLDELGLFLRSLWHSTRHGESNARQTFKGTGR
jgi:transposase